jgi:hypothetical protein
VSLLHTSEPVDRQSLRRRQCYTAVFILNFTLHQLQYLESSNVVLILCILILIQLVPEAPSSGTKWLRYQGDYHHHHHHHHHHHPVTRLGMHENFTFTPPNVFMTWCLIKHRDKFTFIFLTFNLSTFYSLVSCKK